MATYIGQNLTQGSRQRVSYTATANQTTFSAGYAPGFVDVYQNGLLLPTSEYTASDGSTVVLNTGAALNDEIEIIGQFLFAVEDTVSSSSGGTFSSTVNVLGDFTVQDNFTVDTNTLYVDATNNRVGIGTTSPDTILEIVDRAPVLQIRDTNTGISDNLATLRLAETGAGDTTDNYYDLALENGDFIINYGGTASRVKIDRTTGYVGINTTVPSSTLDVNGTITADLIALDAATTEARYIKIGGGRTGIGDSYIDLISSGTYPDYGARFVRYGSTQDTQIRHRGTGALQLVADDAGIFRVDTNSLERMRITSDGKVGINTSAPETFFHVDDKDGNGPTVIFEGGGTNTDTPAAGEQTLFLKTGSGTGDLSTGIGFFGTFESFPGDTGNRRAADIRAGFDGGVWGNEYISFNVGVGTGNTGNDAAAMTDERLRITKTAVTANVPITATKFIGHDYYSAYANSTITLTGTDAVVPIDTQLASSSGSVFTLSAGRVTVTKAGTYMITYDVTTNITSGTGRSDSRALLYKNAVAVTGTESRMYNRTLGTGSSTGSATVILTLVANDIIDIRASQNSGADTIATLADASRLTITEV